MTKTLDSRPQSPFPGESQSLTFFLKFEFYSTDIHFNTSTSSLLLSFHFHSISIFQLPHVWVIIDVSPATFDESEWRDINGRVGVTAPLCLSISTHNSSRCWQNDAVLTEFAWCVNVVSSSMSLESAEVIGAASLSEFSVKCVASLITTNIFLYMLFGSVTMQNKLLTVLFQLKMPPNSI